MKCSKQLLSTIMVIAFISLFVSCKNNEKKDVEKDETKQEVAVKNVNPIVLFENDYAKVVKASLEPGEAQPSHEGENRVIYALSDYAVDWEEQGEKLGTKTWKKGDVHYHDAGSHAAINNGTTKAEWLVFSKKNAELPKCDENTMANDVVSVAPEFSETLFENDDFIVTKVNLAVGQSIPMHSGINRIIYSLTDYNLNYESDKEGSVDKKFNKGYIHWHETCQHALKNNGDTEAQFLVVSYK